MRTLELQMRLGIAKLLQPVQHIGERQVQIKNMEAFDSLGVVSVLLDILTAERREALELLNGVIEFTSPDSPVYLHALGMAAKLSELVEAAGMSCEDEGCPHYGTAHSHALMATPPHPAPPQAPAEPIPSGVYRLTRPDNAVAFYQVGTDKAMGYDFMVKWLPRRAEFPEGRPV